MNTIVKTHIGAYGIIIRNHKIALIKKARGGYKGKLDLPGGGIEHNETPMEALKRELMEEISGTLIEATLFDATSVTFKWQVKEDVIEDLHHIGLLYNVTIQEEELKNDGDGLDSNGAVWMDIDDLTENNVSPFVWHVLNKIK